MEEYNIIGKIKHWKSLWVSLLKTEEGIPDDASSRGT